MGAYTWPFQKGQKSCLGGNADPSPWGRKRTGDYQSFLRLMRPNCWASSPVIPTKGWLPSRKNWMSSGAEEQSCKWDTIGAKGAGGINMILALLEDLFGGLRVWDDWLQLRGTSQCRTFFSVRLVEALMRAGLHVSFAGEVFYSEESSRASGLLYPTKHGRAFLQEQEPGAIAERSLALSNWVSPNELADPLGLEQLEL